ncbi:MAG: CotH kinase family protein, partial [Marinicella sp.]
MNRFKKIIIFSLIFTVPVNIFGLIWLHNTSQSYFAQDNLEVAMERGPRLHRFGQAEFLDLKAKTQKLFGIYKPADVELIIKDNNQSRLNSNLPFSGMEYQDDGFMIYQNKALKGKLRYRGDHYYHWLFPTKSWRFKASKKNILNGTQRFNFIIPKDEALLLNHASYMLAKKFDLLAPESDLVSLAINGVYKGPRLMVEQIDESFLRKNKRMPNDIYKG